MIYLMQKITYSVKEKLNLLNEATEFYREYSEYQAEFKNMYKVFNLTKRYLDDELRERKNKIFTDEELDIILRAIVEVFVEEEKLDLENNKNDEKQWIKAGLWKLIWIIKWKKESIDSLKELMKITRQTYWIKEDKEVEIKKIMKSLSKQFKK